MAHTPGPWKIDVPFPNEVYVEGPNGCVVAFVVHNDDERKEQDADAHLIAAAPDLLTACEAALATVDAECRPDHHGLCQEHNLEPIEDCWVRKCRAAIASARGG